MGSGGAKEPKPNFDNSKLIINPPSSYSNNDNNTNYKYDINNNNKESFQKRFPFQYNTAELNNLLKNFLKEQKIQDSFFTNQDIDDYAFNLLKKKELKDLSNFFQSNQSNMIDYLENKIDEIINSDINFANIAENIFSIEKAEQIYAGKIKKEVMNIESNEQEFEIKYLTVMVVGKSGVGKSTLINNLLNLKGNERAKFGTGNFVTKGIGCYKSKEFPLMRLIDTRGIELNHNYGADAVKEEATQFINQQIRNNKPNDFVQCIWYCITGNRFEQVEIDLLNSLRDAYDNNSIPIIIIYTQATDNNAINGMKDYIKDKNIDAKFINILAERKELVNGQYLEPFGLDELINETLSKCKQAMKGEMRSVMTNNISYNISKKLKEENKYIAKYIYEALVLKVISTYENVLSDEEFIRFIINLLGTNIEYFLEKNMTEKSFISFRNQDIINRQLSSYIKNYKNYTNQLIAPLLNKCPIDFIDYQVLIQKKENKEIKIKNKRCLKEFVDTSTKFLNDNYYYISQINFIYHFSKTLLPKSTTAFEEIANQITSKMISVREIQNLISDCFLKKFGEFEKRVNKFFNNNKIFRSNHNNDFNLDNQNFLNNNNFNMNNNYNYNNPRNELHQYNNSYENELPDYNEINNIQSGNRNNEYYPGFN